MYRRSKCDARENAQFVKDVSRSVDFPGSRPDIRKAGVAYDGQKRGNPGNPDISHWSPFSKLSF